MADKWLFRPKLESLQEDLQEINRLISLRMEGLNRFNHPYRYLEWVHGMIETALQVQAQGVDTTPIG